MGTVFDIKDDELFVYPLTLMWRTPFETYFFPSSGILEYSLTSQHIIDRVKHGNGYFLLECAAEAWVRPDQLKLIHRYFKSHNVPMNKVIYLTGCMNAEDVYNDWLTSMNMSTANENKMNLISYPSARYAFATSHMANFDEPEYNTETVPDKLFLCWNRRFRPHRSILMIALDKLGLVDRSYYSMGKVDPEFQSDEFVNSSRLNFDDNPFGLTRIDLIKLVDKLPIEIDGATEITEMCADKSGNARVFYQQSLISLVTETNWDLPHLTSTEKSFKPFKDKHPFIIIGVNGALKSMRRLGFMTFSEFWDESYDEVKDPYVRLVEVIKVCKEISTWDNEKILDFKRRVKPIIEHNYQLLKNSSTAEIASQVEEIVKKNSKI